MFTDFRDLVIKTWYLHTLQNISGWKSVYGTGKQNLPKPVPTALTGINFKPWRHQYPAREELHGTQSTFLSVYLKKKRPIGRLCSAGCR